MEEAILVNNMSNNVPPPAFAPSDNGSSFNRVGREGIDYSEILDDLLDDCSISIDQAPASRGKLVQEEKSHARDDPNEMKSVPLPTKRGILTTWHGTTLSDKTHPGTATAAHSSASSQVLVADHDHHKRSKVEDVVSAQTPRSVSNMNSCQSQPFDIQSHLSNTPGSTLSRKLRNCELAKRSRIRKKFLFESLQGEVMNLQAINSHLRRLIQRHIPLHAQRILDECCQKNPLFDQTKSMDEQQTKAGLHLSSADFTLVSVLSLGQRNFILTDPHLPDNPIVFASPGFYQLTGYTPDQVLGRNCRFLQGPGTDATTTQVIKTSIIYGVDVTICILNYKSDGQPFWNQLFVAALRDGEDRIVNYMGVVCEVDESIESSSALEEKVNMVLPLPTKQK